MQTEPYNSKSDERLTKIPKTVTNVNIIVHTLTNIKLRGPYCQVLGLLHRISRIDIKTHEYISCMFKRKCHVHIKIMFPHNMKIALTHHF